MGNGRSTIRFALGQLYPDGGPETPTVSPVIDGADLATMAADFEAGQHLEPVGGYGGLVPSYYRFGPLDRYLLGQAEHFGARIAILGCNCGEWGCWPLMTTVAVADGDVTWSEFEQPHRKDRDYGGFGPFVFDGAHYRDALRELNASFPDSPT
jgi:hypothetical protein